MRKILSIFAAALVAIAVNADPVVLPATLDVNNVSFRSEGMPDFVLEEGDYAGTYFDMGAHDSANDTLLYAQWDVTIEPIMYTVGVVVYNTNSWRVQLDLLNQADEVVKAIRYKGSSGQCGQYGIGTLDLTDLAAGNYKVRVHAATAWSAMKLKDVIFVANYAGVNVDLPGTLLPAYAELSSGATVSNNAIAFAPSTANNEFATWNVTFAEAGNFDVTIDMSASNGHTYGVALLSADGATEIGAVAEEQAWDTGVKALGAIEVPAAGSYVVKLTNATQWSEAVLNSITFAAPAPYEPLMKTIYCKMDKGWWKADGAAVGIYAWGDNSAQLAAWPGVRMAPVEGEADLWSFELDINTYKNCIFTRVNGEGDVADWGAKTADLTIPTDENDMYTITSEAAVWGDPGVEGAWSKYEPAAPVVDEWAEIAFSAPATADEIAADASFTVDGFTVAITDPDNKMSIDANNCRFGSAADYKMYSHRLKSSGKSSATKNFMTLTIPEAGTLRIAVRTGSNSATDRNLVLKQGDDTLYNQVIVETMAVKVMEGETEVSVYPFVEVPVEAGTVALSYPVNGLNFYAFAFKAEGGETPVVLEAPDAAPAAPTYAGYQVHAAYSATYNADCNFGEWGSGTAYTQEEFGKKYVTTGLGYFGLEFTGMDCSEMEALHLDVWAANDITFRVVPIHGGAEVGVTVNVQGQQWNAIDIALSEFAGVENWSNVYQIKIDNASNLTFWLNNVYFYTTQEKTVDIADGYYLIGNINGWDIHNLTVDHLFAVNPDNEAEYVLHYTLAEGNEFKVVSVANNEIAAWYPAEAGNYVVDFAHAGEKDILFRPDYQGGEGWHAGCIYVEVDANANPWETWFASYDSWNPETESYLEWDGENQKATIHINVDKYGQWRAQVKYHGPVAEEGKCYRVALKLKSNNAISNVTVKYQDNVEMIYVNDIALAANVEYVFDQTAAGIAGGNGIMALDFGFAHAGDIIEIYDVVIEETECPQVEHTYTVAGGNADLFGTAWDPANTANDMTKLEDGTYKWEKTEITLPAGNVEFKVVEDHAWTVCYPAENYQLVIPEAGVYTITITYNPEGNVVAGDAVKTGDAQVDPVVSIAGSMNSWNASADVMVLAADKATASITLNLAAQTYEFKVVLNGSEWRSNAHEFTRENATAAEMTGNLDNMHLVADIAGDYIFTWTFATNTLVITFPQGEGIDNTAVETKAIKRIVNGQLFIEMNGVLYNAQGILVR